MDIIEALVEKLLKSIEEDDLIKGADSRKFRQLLNSIKNAKNSGALSPQQRAQAIQEAIKIARGEKGQVSVKRNQAKDTLAFKNVADQINKMHAAGDIEGAHKMYSSIPQNTLPKGMEDYHPDYMHYGLTPTHWGHLSDPSHRQAVHDIHKQVLSGELDTHPDYQHIAPKVRALNMPKPQK